MPQPSPPFPKNLSSSSRPPSAATSSPGT
jgi:hypothetical protein